MLGATPTIGRLFVSFLSRCDNGSLVSSSSSSSSSSPSVFWPGCVPARGVPLFWPAGWPLPPFAPGAPTWPESPDEGAPIWAFPDVAGLRPVPIEPFDPFRLLSVSVKKCVFTGAAASAIYDGGIVVRVAAAYACSIGISLGSRARTGTQSLFTIGSVIADPLTNLMSVVPSVTPSLNFFKSVRYPYGGGTDRPIGPGRPRL